MEVAPFQGCKHKAEIHCGIEDVRCNGMGLVSINSVCLRHWDYGRCAGLLLLENFELFMVENVTRITKSTRVT